MIELRFWCPEHKYQFWTTDYEVAKFGIPVCPICEKETVRKEPLIPDEEEEDVEIKGDPYSTCRDVDCIPGSGLDKPPPRKTY